MLRPLDCLLGSTLRKLPVLLGIVLAPTLLATTLTIPAAAGGDATTWAAGFHRPGMTGQLHALSTYGGDLVVGGYISRAGGTYVEGVARWDGTNWYGFGDGIDGVVYSLVVFRGDLIAAGNFTHTGSEHVTNIARWDGTRWRPLGSGIDGFGVYALTVYENRLIVGGWFDGAGGVSADNLAVWDGSSWSEFEGGAGHIVRALEVHGGNLVVGGKFLTIGGTNNSYLAKWDGAAWRSLGANSQPDNQVYCVESHQGTLYVGGQFTAIGGMNAGRIATWNGSFWSTFGAGCDDIVEDIAVSGVDVYVGGRFDDAGGVVAHRQARWNGSSWRMISFQGTDGWVREVEIVGGTVFWAGSFYTAGGHYVNAITAGTNSTVGGGLGVTLQLHTLAANDGKLFAAGDFLFAGETELHNIARLDEDGWANISGTNGQIYALTVWQGDVIAGGDYTTFGGIGGHRGISRNVINAWWEPMGDGLDDDVRALAVYDDELYAGGWFYFSGSTLVHKIARWDGEAWQTIGGVYYDGFPVEPSVHALLPHGDQLIVGGFFNRVGSGQEAASIAAWDETGWSNLGGGVDGTVDALATYDGKLIVGGGFETIGETPVSNLATWDGTQWSDLGGGLDGTVSTLGTYRGDLIVSGNFSFAGGVPAEGIARWDGVTWTSFGSGFDSGPRAILEFGSDLWVGGSFFSAGGIPSKSIARWTDAEASQVPPELGEPRAVTTLDLHPHPIRETTVLSFELASAATVEMTLHDAQGRRVWSRGSERFDAGRHERTLDLGAPSLNLPPGVFFLRVSTGREVRTRRVVVR